MADKQALLAATGWWRRHDQVDVGLGLVADAAIWLTTPHSVLRRGDASGLAGGVIVASAALAAMTLTPIAIVLALSPGPRLQALLRYHRATVRRSMAWAVMLNLTATGVGVLDLSVDSGTYPVLPLRWVVVSAEVAALFAMARLMWFFLSLLLLDEVDKTNVEQEGASTYNRPPVS